MSQIAELVRPEIFQLGSAPVGLPKSLKKRLFLGAAALIVAGKLGLMAYQAVAGTAPAMAAQEKRVTRIEAVHHHV